ncbi:MAG: hypothetical protein LBC80_07380 [Treponema sp.]|jgi:hypothetical protein|nr:hypothetical protein [Treponema sp.]
MKNSNRARLWQIAAMIILIGFIVVACDEDNGKGTDKTVSVGIQTGTLTAGTPGHVTFAVTTANINNGIYQAVVAGLPTGVTVYGQLAISSNSGTLTLAGGTNTTAAVTSTLKLTVDGATSSSFTLTVSPSGGEECECGEPCDCDCGALCDCECEDCQKCTDCGTTPCSCKAEPLPGVNFSPITSVLADWGVMQQRIRSTQSSLMDQSNAIAGRFAGWESDLQTGSAAQGFAKNVQTAQGHIRRSYNGTDVSPFTVGNVKTAVSAQIDGMIQQILPFIGQQDRALFTAKIEAFKQATVYNQRRNYPQGGFDEAADALWDSLSLPMEANPSAWATFNDYTQAAPLLKTLLEAALPAELGPYRDDILRQLECYAKFDGWTQDLEHLNYLKSDDSLGTAWT